MTSFLISFCVAAVILSVSKWLLSDGEMKSITNFLLSVVFLSTVLSAVLKTDFSFFKTNVQNDDTYSTALSENVATVVLETVLTGEGISYEKIETKADKQEDGSIIISEVTVYSKNCDEKKISDTIYGKTDVKNVEVISD